MRKVNLLKALVLVLISTLAFGQKKDCTTGCNCSFDGVISDAQTGIPIPFATIQIKDTQKGVLTDENGHFILENLCEQEFDIIVSHIGYKSVTHHHDLFHPHMNVQLAPDDMILESIVVEGEEEQTGLATVSQSQLSKKELDLVKNESLGDALGRITGVSTMKTGSNIVKPIIHGLYGNRILIINNGIRHEGQSWGNDHAPEIDLSQIDNITLVKGAAAIKYGPGAMGGVIILDPPKMDLLTNHLHGEAEIEAASNGRSLSNNVVLQQGYKNWAWLAQVSGRYQGDMKAPNYILTNTGAREFSYLLGTMYHKKNFNLELSYSHIEQELGILRGSVVGNLDDLARAMEAPEPFYTSDFSYDINNPHQEVSHDATIAKGTINFSNSQLKLEYGLQLNKRQEYDVRKAQNNQIPSINLELYTHTFDAEWIHPEVAGWEGSIGGQWLYQDNNNIPGTNTVPFVPNYNNTRFGLYIAESKPFNEITVEAGLRFDYQKNDVRGRKPNAEVYRQDLTYNSVTGLVGISTGIGTYGKFQTSIGSSWRPPNVAELYSYGKHENIYEFGLWRWELNNSGNIQSSSEVFDNSNKAIDNETSFKWLSTYSLDKKNFRMELSPYVNYIQNYIFTKPAGILQSVRGPFPYYVYDQTDALLIGFDATLIQKHNSYLSSKWQASYLHAENLEDHSYFVGIPSQKLSYFFTFDKKVGKLQNLNAGLEASYVFKQYNAPQTITVAEIQEAYGSNDPILENRNDSFDFLNAPDGYLMLNAHANITVKKFIIGARVKNLLNTSYRDYTNSMRYYADEPGINFLISAKYKF